MLTRYLFLGKLFFYLNNQSVHWYNWCLKSELEVIISCWHVHSKPHVTLSQHTCLVGMIQNWKKKSPSRYWQTDHRREFLVYSCRQIYSLKNWGWEIHSAMLRRAGAPVRSAQGRNPTLTVNLWQSLPFPTGTACWANPMWNRHWRLGRNRNTQRVQININQ